MSRSFASRRSTGEKRESISIPPSATIYSDLKGKVALVTGGANGIGAATVRAFCEQGARVFFCDTDVEAGRALEKSLAGGARVASSSLISPPLPSDGGEGRGEEVRPYWDPRSSVLSPPVPRRERKKSFMQSCGGAVFQKVDLLTEKEVGRWINGIGDRCKEIHILVNNAAADPRIALGDCSVEDWDRLFARNLRAYFLCVREAVKWMPRSGGVIVNFASITFHLGPANMSAYVATKGGVIALTRSLARELGPRRIRVNTVSPGWIMTERQLREFVTPATKKLIRRSQCIPELIQPDEIAKVVLFLSSQASSALTGQEILADRGWAHS